MPSGVDSAMARVPSEILDAFFHGQGDVLGDVLADDVELRDVTLPLPITGRDAVVARLAVYDDLLEGSQTEVQTVLVEGDRAAAEWILRGRHRGSLLGEEPTGAEIAVSIAGFFEFEDGRIARLRIYYDAAMLYRQLGVPVNVGGPASPITGG